MNNKTMILSLLAMASVDAMAQRITAKNENNAKTPDFQPFG